MKHSIPPFLPATLPEVLLQLAEDFNEQTNLAAKQTAAAAILKEYFFCYRLPEVRRFMWQLLAGSLSSGKMPGLRKAAARHELIFFYEFTLMLMDAVDCLNAGGKASASDKQKGG